MKKKVYDDDDGRVIADMSDLSRTPVLIPDPARIGRLRKKPALLREEEEKEERPWEQPPELSKEERRAFIGGAVAASLVVGAVFILAIFGLIFLILHMGK